ncbi:hypothetical protein RAB80_012392 [Fusarium oxysporum f. sp. vasinfectum]|nr:hypothetical protein RAB80_012392 [Fusarium oxysporum f. sp. vasinfectum]
MADSHIPSVPPPWTLKGDIYAFIFWTSPSQANEGLPAMAYSPLEGQSDFAKDQKALGGLNWNVPKHLAKFDWTDNSNGSITAKVYPHDTLPTDSASSESASPDHTPFFQATFKPIRYAPSFPFRTSWINYLGFDTTLVFPPLPEGAGSQGELPGTDQWCSVVPQQSTSKCMLGWFDVEQHRDEEGEVNG